MARRDVLDVWLYGMLVASVGEPRVGRAELQFSRQARDTLGAGSRVLSLALPVQDRRIKDQAPPNNPVGAFLQGLMPEGQLLQQVASRWGVSTLDRIGLLRHIGKECAGAVQFLPEGKTPTPGELRALTSGEVDALVESMPTLDSPPGAELHASLAGIQDKILLTRTGQGWSWPYQGAASSHVIKPAPLNSPVRGLVEWEQWTLQVARGAGVAAARSSIEQFGTRTAVVVERYDRTAAGERIHQEDFCQALGLDPLAKYETPAESSRYRGQSRFTRIAQLAAPLAQDPQQWRSDLLRLVTFNAIIGNADAHAKNYSLLLHRDATVSMAPLYDAAPIAHLNPMFTSFGMVVAGQHRIDQITPQALVAEATAWGMDPTHACRIIDETTAATWDIAHTTPPPDEQDVLARLDATWRTRGWHHTTAPTQLHSRTAPAQDSGADDPAGRVWVPTHTRNGRTVSGYWRRPRTARGVREN